MELTSAIARLWLAWRPALRVAVVAAIATRLLIFAAGVIVTSAQAERTAGVSTSLAQLPDHWDASWYVGIAAGGYRWTPDESNPRIAFFPGWPLLMRAAGTALGLPDRPAPWLWMGVCLSTICFIGALAVLYRVTSALGGAGSGDRVVWLVASYPFALFFGQVYSESLYLLAGVAAVYLAQQARSVPTFLWGVAAGATRATGVFLVAPLLWRTGDGLSKPTGIAAAALGPVVGLLSYVLWVKSTTGEWMAWAAAQQHFGRSLASPHLPFAEVLATIRANGPVDVLLTRPHDVANVAAVAFMAICVVPTMRRLGVGAGAFVAASLLLPLSVGGLMGVGRFTSVIFPVFVWLALSLSNRVFVAVSGCWLALQMVLAALFFLDWPVL